MEGMEGMEGMERMEAMEAMERIGRNSLANNIWLRHHSDPEPWRMVPIMRCESTRQANLGVQIDMYHAERPPQ